VHGVQCAIAHPIRIALGVCRKLNDPLGDLNTAIVVTLPALGAGNTNATTTAWGFQL
jgi:hypothetical protein